MATVQALARRARNVVARTILLAALRPGLEPTPAIGQLVDLLEPLNDLARPTW
jgi:hypothetical protein